MTKKILIIGGVGGGSTVASQIRRLDQEAEIILFDKGEYIAFSNCGMPYHIGGIIQERDKLLTNPEKFAEKYGIDLRLFCEVTNINRKAKSITYTDKTGDHQESYDILILSPGASAVIPKIAGINEQNTFTLRTIPDMDKIYSFIQKNNPQSCAIVGGGFVGMEMAENLQARNIKCTIIDRSKHVMKMFDQDVATIIQDHLKEKGITLHVNTSLDSFSNSGHNLHLSNRESLQADMTILAVGIKPNTKLAKKANLELGDSSAIAVNEYMQTTDPSIFALGDVVETADYQTGTPRNVALASPAHRQAYIIANHICDEPIPYAGTLGTSIVKIFDMVLGTTGQTSETLNQKNIAFQTVTHEALSNAGYYPGAEKLFMKILFQPSNGKLIGAQVVGEKGVDKRLGILATAIKGELTVADLTELELGYAPPYSSPKDPINIIGYKALSELNN